MLVLAPLSQTELDFEIVCSPGTYVRSVAHDLGQKLGCGAHLWSLRRTRSGGFSLDRAVTLEQLEHAGLPERWTMLISSNELLAHLPALNLSAETIAAVLHGCAFNLADGFVGTGASTLFRMVGPTGDLLGLAERVDAPELPAGTRFHPMLVL
jgi:tRNA pseudouridine55 synthase